MKKLILTGLILSILMLMAFPALAKHKGRSDQGGPEGNPTGRVEQLELLLDLSPEQATEIRQLVESHRDQSRKQREVARNNYEQVRKVMESEPLDETRLRILLHEQAELKVQKMVSKHAIREEVNQVLTPEQQAKRDALKQMKRQRMGFGKRMSLQMRNN